MRGQRRDLLTMMPLSTLKASIGKPAMFQARIATGSPSVALRVKCLEQGIVFFWHKSCHSLMTVCTEKKKFL